MYVYSAVVTDVHDGDTVSVDVDLGFRTWRHAAALRVGGISARELSMPGGREAREHLAGLLPVGTRVVIRSVRLDRDPAEDMSFERYVIVVQLPNGTDLGGLLVETGWACPWNGRTKPTPYPNWPIT